MQKIKLMTLALAAAFSVGAHAADLAPAGSKAPDTGATLTKNEAVTELPRATEKTTIGRLSEKTLKLYELEIDAKIKDAEKKISGVGDSKSSFNDMPLPAIAPMPIGIPAKVQESESFVATAIFGKTNDLKAELIANGKPFLVKRGGTNIPGWTVTNITTERVTLSNGKKTKEVFLSTQSTQTNGNGGSGIAPSAMPGLPNVTGVN